MIEDPLIDQPMRTKDRSLFAQDWIPKSCFQIKIIKPSRDSFNSSLQELALSRWKRILFTHSFDHPLGQAVTAYWAGIFYKKYPRFFETGAFSCPPLLDENFYSFSLKQSPNFIPPKGFGFGFTEALKKEKLAKMALDQKIGYTDAV